MKSPPTRTTYSASTSAPTPNTADDEDTASPSLPVQRDQQRRVGAGDEHDDRDPERVVVDHGLAEIRGARRPVRARGFLRERRVGDEAPVVAHAEDLVRDGERECRADDAEPRTPAGVAPLRDEHDRDEADRHEHELRSYERPETEHDRGPEREPSLVAFIGRRRGRRLVRRRPSRPLDAGLTRRPAREERERRAQPRERQPALEAARGEAPHRSEHREHERSRGDPDRVRRLAALEHHRAPDREREPGEGQPDAGEHGDPLEAQRRDDVAESEEEHPQWARRGLDPLTGVEHRAVARLDLADDAEVDEPVVGHPPGVPGAHGEDHDRERQEARERPSSPLPGPSPQRIHLSRPT